MRTIFINGKEDGLREKYYKNGRLEWSTNIKDGKEDGLRENFHENGQLFSRVNYKNGKQDGLWEYFEDIRYPPIPQPLFF